MYELSCMQSRKIQKKGTCIENRIVLFYFLAYKAGDKTAAKAGWMKATYKLSVMNGG